jgi:5-methylcytosine-specific restriction endonuclease McrA
MSGPLSTHAYQRLRRAVLATTDICCICGHRIDMTLSGRHPDGPTLEHKHPRSRGGAVMDPRNCAPAHLRCNSARGNRDTTPLRTSRPW